MYRCVCGFAHVLKSSYARARLPIPQSMLLARRLIRLAEQILLRRSGHRGGGGLHQVRYQLHT